MKTANYSATPAGICSAARAGDVEAIDRILAARPELLSVDNPHNWTKTVEGHEVRGSYNKKPVEVAAFFNQPAAVAKLLEISRDSHAICKPWDDHLPFDGHFDALSIARTLAHQEVIDAIEADVMKRIYVDPDLLNEANSDGQTVLHYAASQGHLPLVRTLLEQGADPDPTVKSGRRVIHAILDCAADSSERHETARLLIEKGAANDLWVATALDDVDRVRELLASDKSLVKKHYRPDRARLSDGFPLVRACAQGNRAIVELLLEHGADVNATSQGDDPPEFGMPIIAATYGKHYEIAHLLLDHGASVAAYPNCAAPFVDMMYYASVEQSPDWLALGELKYVTDDARSHLQSNDAGASEAVKLYERVLSLGGEPQMYSHVKMKNHREIERLLKAQPEVTARNPRGSDTVFNCLAHAAAWLGDVETMELCLTLQPELHSAALASDHIRSAIRSHNRDGSFADFRRIIEVNLEFLRNEGAGVDAIDPLWLLADDFLENYSYGTHPELPAMDDLLNLAELFLEYGADINRRHEESGRTPLAHAVNEGHVEYVAFLLERGATIHKDDPPETNPIALAQKHGFSEILALLGESDERWPLEAVKDGDSNSDDLVEPAYVTSPAKMTPLDNAVIRLGVAKIEETFRPCGSDGDVHRRFIEFPEPFPDDQFEDVRLIITNRNHPQILGSATTCISNGVQGFTLAAQHSISKREVSGGESRDIDGVEFSWMAVLPTDVPQEKRFEVRYGLVPWREYPGHQYHEYDDVRDLYAKEPISVATGTKFVFLTTTTSNVINGSASNADERGITDLAGFQVSRHDGGGRMYYLVIAERNDTSVEKEAADNETANNKAAGGRVTPAGKGHFDSGTVWVHTSRAKPVSFYPTGMFCAWRGHWMRFLKPFRDRMPCVFVSANSHGVSGHHACVVPMSRDCSQDSFSISSLNRDPVRGESSFDCIAFGHCDVAPDEVAAANQGDTPESTGWERFLAFECDEVSYELAASGKIGVNEFGDHGGSLLLHAIYERHERVHTALARRLFALGADPNQSHPVTRLTPLHLAAVLGRIDMVNLLIERGANVNAVTADGTKSDFPTAHDCERIGREPIRDHVGETPLHLAMLRRKFEVARLLLDAGADPNAEDSNGARPIDYLPRWNTYPDNEKHWELVNHRTKATREDILAIIRWRQST